MSNLTAAWHGTIRAGERQLIDRHDWRGRWADGSLSLVAEDELPGGAGDRYLGSSMVGDRCSWFAVRLAPGESVSINATVALQASATSGMLFMLNTGPQTIWPMLTLNEDFQ